MVSLARRCMQVSFRVGTSLNLFLVSFFMIMIIIIIFFYYSSSSSSFTRIWKVDDAVKEEKDHVARDSVSVQKRRERQRGGGEGADVCVSSFHSYVRFARIFGEGRSRGRDPPIKLPFRHDSNFIRLSLSTLLWSSSSSSPPPPSSSSSSYTSLYTHKYKSTCGSARTAKSKRLRTKNVERNDKTEVCPGRYFMREPLRGRIMDHKNASCTYPRARAL